MLPHGTEAGGMGHGAYRALPRGQGWGDEPSSSHGNFFSAFAGGSGSYTDGFAYTSGVSVGGGGGGGVYGGVSHLTKQLAFGQTPPPPLPHPRRNASFAGGSGGGGGGSKSLRQTASLPEVGRASASGRLPPVQSRHPSSLRPQGGANKQPHALRGGSGSEQRLRGRGGGALGGVGGGGGGGGGGRDVDSGSPDLSSRGGGGPWAHGSITRRGKLALSDPVYTADEVESMQLKQDLEYMQKKDMGQDERRQLYARIQEAEQRHGKVSEDGALDPAAAAARRPTLSAVQEESARRNCPPRDPRLRNPDEESDSEGEGDRGAHPAEAAEATAKVIGAHRDRDWRPIVAQACMAIARIDKTLAALDESSGPDPAAVAALREGLPRPTNFAADGVTPLVFAAEHGLLLSNAEATADHDSERAVARGNLIDILMRDADAQGASGEEKSAVLGRMLDAASVQEDETARALSMMDRLMRVMCISESQRGVAAATSHKIKSAAEMAVVGLSLDDDEMTLDDAVIAVRTITVTTGDLSFDMFRSLLARCVPNKLLPDHVTCSLYLDARSSAGRVTPKTFQEVAMTCLEMNRM